jgi:hypothetical protein
VDANWNLVSSTHTIAITASDASAVLPANAALVAGTKTFSVTLTTASSTGWTVTAKDTNAPLLTANTGAGSVTAGGLGAGSYSVTVSGSPTNLTNGVNVLANPLLIATGNASAQIGNITSAAECDIRQLLSDRCRLLYSRNRIIPNYRHRYNGCFFRIKPLRVSGDKCP